MSPLSLLTFFAAAAAAKKVSAAPHRGEANRPLRKQGEANAVGKQPKQGAAGKNQPSRAQHQKSHYMNPTLTYWRFQKNRPTIRNTKPARQSCKARETREPSRQRGKKRPYPSARTPAAGADHTIGDNQPCPLPSGRKHALAVFCPVSLAVRPAPRGNTQPIAQSP